MNLFGKYRKEKEAIRIPHYVVEEKPADFVLHRKTFTDKSTIGEIFLNNVFQCYSLEDTIRHGAKIPGETAIPSGRYEIVINFSARFNKLMPLLLEVPEFTAIRIHPGNTDTDTQGCILVGETALTDFVGYSQNAFNDLFPKIEELMKKKEVYIEII